MAESTHPPNDATNQIDLNNVTGKDIDDLLNEIDKNEVSVTLISSTLGLFSFFPQLCICLMKNKYDIDEDNDNMNELPNAKHIYPTPKDIDDELSWKQITKEIGNGNMTFIKGIITSNDIDINAQNPENGKTLLIYSVIIGNIDLVNIICNFGADVHIKDHDEMDAFDYTEKNMDNIK